MNPRKSDPGGNAAGRGRPVRASEAPTSARGSAAVAHPAAPSFTLVLGFDGGGFDDVAAVRFVDDRSDHFLRLARAM